MKRAAGAIAGRNGSHGQLRALQSAEMLEGVGAAYAQSGRYGLRRGMAAPLDSSTSRINTANRQPLPSKSQVMPTA